MVRWWPCEKKETRTRLPQGEGLKFFTSMGVE